MADMAGSTGIAQTSGSNGKGHYKPPFKFGMGVPLGNEFEVVTDKNAYARSKQHGTLSPILRHGPMVRTTSG